MANSSRTYMLVVDNQGFSSTDTVMGWINPGTTASIEILRVVAGQLYDDRGQSTSYPLDPTIHASSVNGTREILLFTQATSFPTVTGRTPAKTNASDPASAIVSGTGGAGTCGGPSSSDGAGARTTLLQSYGWDRGTWLWWPTPEERIVLPAGSSVGFGVSMIQRTASEPDGGCMCVITYREF